MLRYVSNVAPAYKLYAERLKSHKEAKAVVTFKANELDVEHIEEYKVHLS